MKDKLRKALDEIEELESKKILIKKVIFFKNPWDEWEYRAAYFISEIEAKMWLDARVEEYVSKKIEYMVWDTTVSFNEEEDK